MMEPPAKRPRLAFQSHFYRPDDDDDDELNFEPEEISRRRDPGYLLQQERAVAADRLKSTFEHIFEKYERDFSEIGDEIDLRTGEIIVNRGHLEAMRNEKDVGDEPEEQEDEGMLLSELVVSDSEEDVVQDGHDVDDDEEDCILQGRPSQALQVVASSSPPRQPPLPTPVRLASQHRLSHLAHSRYTPMKPSPLSRGVWEIDHDLVEPAWRTPQLPRPSFPGSSPSGRLNTIYQLPAMDGSQSVWASESGSTQWPSPRPGPTFSVRQRAGIRRLAESPARKLLPAPSSDEDDEDEILMGSSHRSGALNLGSGQPPSSPSPKLTTTAINKEKLQSVAALSKLKAKNSHPQSLASESAQSQNVSDLSSTSTAAQSSHSMNPATKTKSKQQVKRPRGRPRKRSPSEEAEHSRHVVQEIDPETENYLPSEAYERSSTAQTLIVAIPFRKAPTPDSLTIVDTSPQSVRRLDALPTPPLQDSEDDGSLAGLDADVVNSALDALNAADGNSPDMAESSGNEEPPPEVETFSRNEIDPSYEFSDEDDIPTREPAPKPPIPAQRRRTSSDSHSRAGIGVMKVKKNTPARKRKRVESPPEPDLLDSFAESGQVDGHLSVALPDEVTLFGTEGMEGIENVATPEEGFAQMDVDAPPAASLKEDLVQPSTQGRAVDTARTTPRRSARQAVPLSLTKATGPSPAPSDDSLGAALDDIIASQKLFEDFDQSLDASPQLTAVESPSKRGRSLSPKVRRRSVRFREEDVEAHEADSSRPRIISTPPLTKGPSRREEAPEIDEATNHENEASNEARIEDGVIVVGSSPRQDRSAATTGGMFAANRARRGKRASLPSTPEVATPPIKPSRGRPLSSNKKKKTFVKRRSLLSITLDDGDGDEDPLNAMSLLTYWTSGATSNSPGTAPTSTPAASHKDGGPASTVRKRIAREGIGGLTTPTKKRAGSPVGSPVGPVIQTPGGHVRRCGVDGYNCEKDFCFTCLGG